MSTTVSNRAFIEAEQYSTFILDQMHDGLLPDSFYRDVTDFGSGETLNIKTIGDTAIQEVEEDAPFKYNPIETGNVQLRINEYVGAAWYVTDKLRQDGAQVEQLQAMQGKEATRAIQEYFETQAMKTLNEGQEPNDPNTINGFAHRMVGRGNNDTITLKDFIRMKLAFNKAEVPYGGRMAIVDPIVESTLNTTFQIVSGSGDMAANPTWQKITEAGMDWDHNFVINLYGWDIIVSNRLPTGTFGDGTTSVADGVANIFMCVADDSCKPLMCAWREMPSVEGGRNKDMKRDEFIQSCRFGQGIQRTESLGIVITSAIEDE